MSISNKHSQHSLLRNDFNPLTIIITTTTVLCDDSSSKDTSDDLTKKNVNILTGCGMLDPTTLPDGLTIAYATSKPTSTFFQDSDKEGYKGVDILLTSQLPERGNETGQMAMRLKPRYHFTSPSSSSTEFKAHVPYMNASNGKLEQIHVTRHVNLAHVLNETNKDKTKKWIHALGLQTLKKNPSDLLKVPKGATACPYLQPKRPRWSAERAAEITQTTTSAPQFFFQSHNNSAQNNHKRRRQQPRQPQRLACWFCLSTPGFETHLVAAIGKHCYVALPKGPLIEGHVLIVPIDHAANSLSTCPKLLQDEIESFLDTMRKYFASINRDIVVFEHNIYREGVMRHMHIQVVPVRVILSLFLFTYSEDSLVSRTQPMSLTMSLYCVPHSQQYHSNVTEILNSRFALEHKHRYPEIAVTQRS